MGANLHSGHDISETAFVVNVSRSLRPDISRDIYAHLWITDKARRLWQELAEEVYPYDHISSSLRNRFYLERVSEFLRTRGDAVFVNIAAGFSNYPFLLEAGCTCAEVDFAHVIDSKVQRTTIWQREGTLPKRTVQTHGADLSTAADRRSLSQALKQWYGQRPSFLMMEGLTYYLAPSVLQELLNIIAAAQVPGSQLAFEYWTPDAADYPVFCRLEQYLAKGFAARTQHYELLDHDFVSAIPGYHLVESSDIAAQELLHSDTRDLQDKNNRLPVHFAVLRKT
jgi:O-methyltransferase involved in polyketide biosynthesis